MGYSTALGIASLIISAVGTGISVVSQQQQAQSQAAIADYNFKVQQSNAKITAAVAQQQAAWNKQAQLAQYQAQQNNAQAYQNQALAAEAQGREQARRMREDNERTLAMQRVKYAKSGVVNEGTPLQVMATSAGLLELGVQDAAYQSELQSRSYQRAAQDEQFQAGFSLMDSQITDYEAAASATGASIQLNQARVDRLSTISQAQGLRTASYGTLLSGLGNTAYQGAYLMKKDKA